VVRFTLRPLYRQEITPVSIEQEGRVGPQSQSGRCADKISSPCRHSYFETSTPLAQSPKFDYQIRINNLLSQLTRVSTVSSCLIYIKSANLGCTYACNESRWYVALRLLCVRATDSFVCPVMLRLTMGIPSKKSVFRRFRRCANVKECTYTNLHSTV
jgi:hypothetical protein